MVYAENKSNKQIGSMIYELKENIENAPSYDEFRNYLDDGYNATTIFEPVIGSLGNLIEYIGCEILQKHRLYTNYLMSEIVFQPNDCRYFRLGRECIFNSRIDENDLKRLDSNKIMASLSFGYDKDDIGKDSRPKIRADMIRTGSLNKILEPIIKESSEHADSMNLFFDMKRLYHDISREYGEGIQTEIYMFYE